MRTATSARTLLRCMLLSVVMLVCTTENLAVAPAHLSDEELAQYPIIVVAQWDKAPFTAHHKHDNDVVVRIEAFTELNVLRVIKGDLARGVHKLKVGWGIGWSADGEYLCSATSTELPGDVQSVTQPNIWFLKKERSWDRNDKTHYLSVSHYRSVQPLVLEDYFKALRARDPEREVPRLLTSDEPEVIGRALRYVSGGTWPWPYGSDLMTRLMGPEKKGKVLRNEARAVAGVMARKDLGDLRPLAVAVYAELEGKRSLRHVRGLLTDDDLQVRAVAAGILVRHRDEASVQGIVRAVAGIENGRISCKIVTGILEWGDSKLIPALIAFLDNGDYAGSVGDDLRIPALKAREALHAMTGHWFPYDARRSLLAWDQVRGLPGVEERRAQLAKLLPCDPVPLRAELIGDGTADASIRVSNKSEQSVTVTRYPSHGSQRWPGGWAGCGPRKREAKKKDDFIVLAPGKSTQYATRLHEGFLLADPADRVLRLTYTCMGENPDEKAWVGLVDVEFGPEWREKRETKMVEELWPNGNLKATGRTVNGKRLGEWHFFNEEGDRIRIVHYNESGGTAKCNPEHPDNKGAGKR